MQLAVCGKTNTGKTTFFSAATLVDAEISNRVFTTIEPNKGVTYVRTKCPCKELGTKCSPQDSKCNDGIRLVPVKLIDIAGLVPGAHLGRGLGNQFLSDIMEASVLIHVVDIAGSTDSNGNAVSHGSHNPEEDIEFFKEEIDYWILGILKKAQLSKRMEHTHDDLANAIYKQLSGLGINLDNVEEAIGKTGITATSANVDMLKFIEILRELNKPIIIAANKIDIDTSGNFEKLKNKGIEIIPCCAEAELALRRAAEKKLIKYLPGDANFEIIGDINDKQKKAMEFISEKILKRYGSTGIQKIIDTAVFELLNMIVVYPVENENRYSDKKGNVLPNAFLMTKGSTALDLAFRVHEDIGKKFISAVDAKTGRSVSAEYELKDGDIISIKAGR
ncbi:MAG: redox-regulated ATPase YchF [Candidatus Aenigmarchaeota archaeon]|nr:redox-regulated ATPase YchF [Candidatus Aenigmarchaeota archaeon]